MGLFVASFVVWAMVHSLTAAAGPKAWIRRRMGAPAYEGLYRLVYNLFSTLSFLPVLFTLAMLVPELVVWSISGPYRYLAYLLQLAGLAGLVISLWQTDVWNFAGIRPAIHYLSGRSEPIPTPKLVTGGAYSLTRHPLYFFSLILLWSNPNMTLDSFVFNLLSTIYFWLGSYHEERRLKALFGQAYEDYRKKVPFLFPIKVGS